MSVVVVCVRAGPFFGWLIDWQVEGVEAAQVLARQRQQDAQQTAIERIVAEERLKCQAGVQDALAATERALAGVESETRVKLHMVHAPVAAWLLLLLLLLLVLAFRCCLLLLVLAFCCCCYPFILW